MIAAKVCLSLSLCAATWCHKKSFKVTFIVHKYKQTYTHTHSHQSNSCARECFCYYLSLSAPCQWYLTPANTSPFLYKKYNLYAVAIWIARKSHFLNFRIFVAYCEIKNDLNGFWTHWHLYKKKKLFTHIQTPFKTSRNASSHICEINTRASNYYSFVLNE